MRMESVRPLDDRVWAVSAGVAAGSGRPAIRRRPSRRPIAVDDFELVRGWSAHPADGVELTLSADDGGAARPCASTSASPAAATPCAPQGRFRRPARELRASVPGARRGARQPPRVQADRRQRRERLVVRPARRDRSRRLAASSRIEEAPDRFRLGAGRRRESSRHLAAIEFAVTAGSGGEGTVWIDDLELRPLPPPGAAPPAPRGHRDLERGRARRPARAVDGDPLTAWAPDAQDDAPALHARPRRVARVRRR